MNISTDKMNDIIRDWVSTEMPRPAGGFETDAQQQEWQDASNRRFEQIVAMDDAAFRALYATKTGNTLSAMNPNGSYDEN